MRAEATGVSNARLGWGRSARSWPQYSSDHSIDDAHWRMLIALLEREDIEGFALLLFGHAIDAAMSSSLAGRGGSHVQLTASEELRPFHSDQRLSVPSPRLMVFVPSSVPKMSTSAGRFANNPTVTTPTI
jgi:hypothetical protein